MIFKAKYWRELGVWVRGHWSHWKWHHSRTSSYSSSTVSMAVCWTVFQIMRDIGRKTPIIHTPLYFNLYGPLESLRVFAQNFNTNCPSLWAIRCVQKYCRKIQRCEQGARTLHTSKILWLKVRTNSKMAAFQCSAARGWRSPIEHVSLSASLYCSKRGAYWDRLCRDVVGRWLVGCHARALWPNGAS